MLTMRGWALKCRCQHTDWQSRRAYLITLGFISLILIAAAISTRTVAQTSVEATPQLREPTETTTFSIAEEVNFSVSAELMKRLRDALVGLPNRLREELLAGDYKAELRSALPAGKYDPPGDDELSFAERGNSTEAIVARVLAGYPALLGPLVLITVAERGPYLIGAAYLVSSDASGNETLTRIDRRVVEVADASDSLVGRTWPRCFFEAIRRFGKDPTHDSNSPECQKTVAPAPRGEAPAPASRNAAAQEASKGMLDDVDARPGVIQIVPSPSAPAASRPATPALEARRSEQSKPAPQTSPPTPVVTAESVIPPESILAPRAASPPMAVAPAATIPSVATGKPRPISHLRAALPAGARLQEEILYYGFSWRPGDQTKIKTVYQRMLQQDDVRNCMRNLETSLGAEDFLKSVLYDFLQGRRNSSLMTKVANYQYHIAINTPERDDRFSARYCLPEAPPIRPFVFHIVNYLSLADAERRLHDWSTTQPSKGWRLPRAIEAFAVASAIWTLWDDRRLDPVIENNLRDRAGFSFWVELEGKRALFSMKITQQRDLIIDYDYAHSTKPTTRALLLAVYN